MRLLDTYFGGGGGKLRMLVITAPEAARMLTAAFGRQIAPPRIGYEILLPKGPKGEEPLIENIAGELRYRPDSRAISAYTLDRLSMTTDVIEYLREHPAFAKKECTPRELMWIETHLPPRYDHSYRWEDYVNQRGLESEGRRENPGGREGSMGPVVAVGLGLGAVAVVGGLAYWLTRPGTDMATVAPGGTPTVGRGGAHQTGDVLTMPAFTAYYEETHASGSPAAAQDVLLINASAVRPDRWFVRLADGSHAWADLPA